MIDHWIEPAEWPAPREHAVHVWLAHLPSVLPALPRLVPMLSDAEMERAAKFHFEVHRERYQLTRGLLRTLLAHYLESKAREIVFAYGEHGKPTLREPVGLCFNASHSGDYAAFAFTRLGETGVDIERVREDLPRREGIALRFFAPGEQAQLELVPEAARARAFYEIWTRKEAFVKARGDGLFSGLDTFEVSLQPPRLLSIAGDGKAAAQWSMAAFPPVTGYSGAVVVKAPECSCSFWNWSPRWLG